MSDPTCPGPTILLSNQRTDGAPLYVLLTAEPDNGGSGVSGLTGIAEGVVTPLGSIANGAIGFETINSGRLYVGVGPFDNPPTPDGPAYFGWIEFSKKPSDTGVWINLSNVDLAGLPLALAGTTTEQKTFTMGYKEPMAPLTVSGTILNRLAALVPKSSPAIIQADSGQTKILSPTLAPDQYRSFAPYRDALCQATAALRIVSDTPEGEAPVDFRGSFMPAATPSDVAVHLTDPNGKALTITLENLTSSIIYACDGGFLTYGGVVYPQNRTDGSADAVITNSTFRNLMIGFNEGYFSPDGLNDSTQFPGQMPFATGAGNPFAEVIHDTSNSYGFPYADSNLKVLLTAEPNRLITLTILDDDKAGGYSPDPGGAQSNQPQSGAYSFGIGAGSAALGEIRIGNWVYLPTSAGSYGGYFPDLPDWTMMRFTGAGDNAYIWVRNGDIDQGACLTAKADWETLENGVKNAAWPADLAWVPGANPPGKPA